MVPKSIFFSRLLPSWLVYECSYFYRRTYANLSTLQPALLARTKKLRWPLDVSAGHPGKDIMYVSISVHGIENMYRRWPNSAETSTQRVHSLKAGKHLIDKWEQCIGWSTGVVALTELIKQIVNAVLGMEGMTVNKMPPSCNVWCIFKHQHCLMKPHKRKLPLTCLQMLPSNKAASVTWCKGFCQVEIRNY